MLLIVSNLKYLSQNFIKFKDQGQFWNPHDVQIPKLSLGVQFDQEIMEKTWETSCCKLTATYCIWKVLDFQVKFRMLTLFSPSSPARPRLTKLGNIFTNAFPL